jgi:uncharacterized protein YodC (DUF2158 family)
MFNVGDIVRLKGGGQDMTVTHSWPDEAPPKYDCWESDYFYGKTQVAWHNTLWELESEIISTGALELKRCPPFTQVNHMPSNTG